MYNSFYSQLNLDDGVEGIIYVRETNPLLEKMNTEVGEGLYLYGGQNSFFLIKSSLQQLYYLGLK